MASQIEQILSGAGSFKGAATTLATPKGMSAWESSILDFGFDKAPGWTKLLKGLVDVLLGVAEHAAGLALPDVEQIVKFCTLAGKNWALLLASWAEDLIDDHGWAGSNTVEYLWSLMKESGWPIGARVWVCWGACIALWPGQQAGESMKKYWGSRINKLKDGETITYPTKFNNEGRPLKKGEKTYTPSALDLGNGGSSSSTYKGQTDQSKALIARSSKVWENYQASVDVEKGMSDTVGKQKASLSDLQSAARTIMLGAKLPIMMGALVLHGDQIIVLAKLIDSAGTKLAGDDTVVVIPSSDDDQSNAMFDAWEDPSKPDEDGGLFNESTKDLLMVAAVAWAIGGD